MQTSLAIILSALFVVGVSSLSSRQSAFASSPMMPLAQTRSQISHHSRGRPLFLNPSDLDGPRQSPNSAQSPQMVSDAAQPAENANFNTPLARDLDQHRQVQHAETSSTQGAPTTSKTGQMIGLARRGWWLSAVAVALDGISAIVAVVCSTLALLSVLFMDIALPSATSLGLIFLSTVSCVAFSVFVAASAASAVIGMLAMSDSIKTYFRMHKPIDIMSEGENDGRM